MSCNVYYVFTPSDLGSLTKRMRKLEWAWLVYCTEIEAAA